VSCELSKKWRRDLENSKGFYLLTDTNIKPMAKQDGIIKIRGKLDNKGKTIRPKQNIDSIVIIL